MRYIVGIDEVGRGPLAGDMYLGVCIISEKSILFPRLSKKHRKHLNLVLEKKKKIFLRDSKRLTQKQREKSFLFLKDKLMHGIVKVPVSMIDDLGLSVAFKNGLEKIFEWIGNNTEAEQTTVFIDGVVGIKNGAGFSSINLLKQADDQVPIVAAASIFAKVNRDFYMRALHPSHPVYDWIHNVGYGTKKHIEAIKKYGVTKYHRRSFLRKILRRN